jgi:competence protein ComFC
MNFLDLLFPRKCLECGKAGNYMCTDCLQKVPNTPEICPICSLYSFGGKSHPRCRYPLGLDGLISGWRHQGVVRKTVLKLKYHFVSDICDELAAKYLKVIKKIPKGIIVPIPLYRRRKNWRGFNQSEELGQRVAKSLGFNFTSDLLIKTSKTLPQARLSKKERKENIKGIFEINKKVLLAKYYLFDDVWTTGSTMKEAAKVLKKAGAKEVWGVTLAR